MEMLDRGIMCLHLRWALVFPVAVICCPGFPDCFSESCPWVLSRAVRLIEIELQSRFEMLRFANRKACNVDAILLCSRAIHNCQP